MLKYNQLQDQRKSLPTFEFKQDLIDAIREYSILVVIGETGTFVIFIGIEF
jgi:pre-mRNA-splicing factor ATP-dependent RNA helicase DHX16